MRKCADKSAKLWGEEMTKVAKVCLVLVILAAITAILHLTGEITSREPAWVYWIFLVASLIAGIWLLIKLRK